METEVSFLCEPLSACVRACVRARVRVRDRCPYLEHFTWLFSMKVSNKLCMPPGGGLHVEAPPNLHSYGTLNTLDTRLLVIVV